MAEIGDIGNLEYLTDLEQEARKYSVQELKEGAIQYADHYGVPRDLMLGYFGAESNWNPAAKNPKSSARGLGQIIDSTGRELGLNITGGPDDDRWDPAKNMDAIGRLFAQRYEIHGGDWKRTLLSVGEPHEGYYNRVKSRARQETSQGLEWREPEMREYRPSLLETAKNYLGYRDLPEFLPVFNRDSGEWEAKTRYEARKLYHGWEEATELERVLGRGLSGLSLGAFDYLQEEFTGEVSRPETMLGTMAGAGLEFGGFMVSPFGAAKWMIGGRLAPTRSGLRGLGQVMAEGGATLGLASSLAGVIPVAMESETLTEGAYNFLKGAASSFMVGALFPLAGLVPTRALRTAATIAGMDFLRTRFHEAPDKGWFTLDDVYRGVLDGSIDKRVLAQKTFDVLVDLYFGSRVPSMNKTMLQLKTNALMQEAARVSAQEAEDNILDIGKSGILRDPVEYKLAQLRAFMPNIGEAQAQSIVRDPEMFQEVMDFQKVGLDKEAHLAAIRAKYPGISDNLANFVFEDMGIVPGETKAGKPGPP